MLLIKTIFRFLLITILLMVNSNALSQETTYLRQDNKASFDTTKINTSAEKVHDDYVRPELFSEGKRWVAWHGNLYLGPNNLFDYNNIEPNFLFYISVDGDEVIDGKSCKRIKLQTQYLGDSCRYCYYNYSREHSETKYFYFYEEGDKIYRYREPGQYWILDENGKETGRVGLKDPYFDLYMDLDISLGDNLIDIGEIDDIRFVEIGGKTRRVVSSSWPEFDFLNHERNWIDGIGSNCCANQWYEYPNLLTRPPLPTRGDFNTTNFSHMQCYLVLCCEKWCPYL